MLRHIYYIHINTTVHLCHLYFDYECPKFNNITIVTSSEFSYYFTIHIIIVKMFIFYYILFIHKQGCDLILSVDKQKNNKRNCR